MTKPCTERQLAYLCDVARDLADYRGTTFDRTATWSFWASEDAATVSLEIERLLGDCRTYRANRARVARPVANRPTPAPRDQVGHPAAVNLTEGIYFKADTVVMVKISEIGRTYGSRLDTSDLDRTNPKAKAKWVYDRGIIGRIGLTAADLITRDQAAELGKGLGVCVKCGALLWDPKSLARGIGPTCAKYWG